MSDQVWKQMQCLVSFEINDPVNITQLEERLGGWGLRPLTRYLWIGQVPQTAPPALPLVTDTIKNDLLPLIDPSVDRLVVIFLEGPHSLSGNLVMP
jgi:hypothetical protein